MDWKQEILKRLDALAAKLGTTTEYLWRVLVRQGYVEGITNAITSLMFLSLLIASIVYLKKAIKFAIKDNWRQDRSFAFVIFACITTALTFAGVCAYVPDAITELVNPEFFALHQLLDTLK